MIPSLSVPSWTSVSERIIPSDSTPRSFALPSRVPSGQHRARAARPSRPGPRPRSARRRRSCARPSPRAARCRPAAGRRRDAARRRAPRPIRKRPPLPSPRGTPTLVMRSTSVPLSASAVASSSTSEPGIAVLLQPGDGDPHQNCSRKRRSFSKNRRRSGTPCLSIAMRSMPRPNAKPCTCSGS